MHKPIVIALGALAALGSLAASASAAPAWCKDAHFDGNVDLANLKDPDPRVVISTFAQVACTQAPELDAHRAELETNRAAWGKRLGMIESDWADVIAYINANGPRNNDVPAYSTKDFSQFTPIDQYLAIAVGFRIDDGRNGTTEHRDYKYYADVFEQHLSEVARYEYISICMGDNMKGYEPPVAEWAMCQADIEKFDLAKFYVQLRGDTAHPGYFKQRIRFEAFDISARIKQQAIDVAAAQKRDPVYKRMFEVAGRARAEWDATLAKETALLATALEMDSASVAASRKQYEGCEAETGDALRAQLAKVPAAPFAKLHDVRFDPTEGFVKDAGPLLVAVPGVNLAAMPYILCQPTTGTADLLAYFMMRTAGYRGPRTTVLSRLLGEKFVLDDTKAELRWPGVRALWTRSGGVISSAGGIVESTKLDGDDVIVTLGKYMVKTEQCVKSHPTHRISEILANGQVRYEEICDKSETINEDQQWTPFRIRKVYAPLLKRGVKFSAVAANGSDLAQDVIAIWPNAKAETPTWLLGAAVK
jgi:hypothetical protein